MACVWENSRNQKCTLVIWSVYVNYCSASIDYRIVPGSFPNPVCQLECATLPWDAAAEGLTTGWWAVMLLFTSFGVHQHGERLSR